MYSTTSTSYLRNHAYIHVVFNDHAYIHLVCNDHTYISCVMKSKTTSLTISVSKQDKESGKLDAKNLQKTALDNSLLAQHK